MEALKARGIGTLIHYPVPLHLQGAFATLGGRPGDFPVAERAAGEIVSLPLYPEMPDAQAVAVAAAVRELAARLT
jgi:dTDP-4-amino-4,6-dideoxygalactose transaminase